MLGSGIAERKGATTAGGVRRTVGDMDALPESVNDAAARINATTSYLQRQTRAHYRPLPLAPTITWRDTPGYLAWTYGDFEGDGTVGVVGVNVNWTPQGDAVEYHRFVDGRFVHDPGWFHGAAPTVVHGRKAITADLDGDGRPDVVIAGHGYDKPPFVGERPLILYNRADGFAAGELPVPPGFYHSVCAGDIDGDGDIDLFFTDCLGDVQPCRVLLNDGRGNFAETPGSFPAELAGKQYFTSELYDIDGDGRLDLVIGGHEMDGADTVVLWGDGTGTFALERSSVLPAVAGFGIVIGIVFIDRPDGGGADIILNRTGDPRGPVGWYNGYHLQYLRRAGDGNFRDVTAATIEGGTSWTAKWITWLRVHDVDRDGRLDVTSEDIADRLEWLNTGRGLRRR